jgi:hypothetical protein
LATPKQSDTKDDQPLPSPPAKGLAWDEAHEDPYAMPISVTALPSLEELLGADDEGKK